MSAADPFDGVRHAMNNVFSKIIGAAELALDQTSDAGLRAELETIIRLAESGAALAAEFA